MRIALCSFAAPWPGNSLAGVYNPAQAAALTALGHPTELFIPSPAAPRWVERVVPRVAKLNARPAEYEYAGVRCHALKAPMPHPSFLRNRVGERWPALCARTVRLAVGDALVAQLRRFRPDFLLAHAAILMGVTATAVARELGIPYGFIEHDPIDYPPDSPGGRFYTSVTRGARVVFEVGHPWVRHLREQLGVRQARVAPNGTVAATDRQRRTPRPAAWAGRRVLLIVGGFIPRKAHAETIRAVAEVVRAGVAPDVLLVVVGEPPAELRQLVAELGMSDRVQFVGFMSQQDVQQYMVWADLFVLPSWWESFGLVYAEALAAETPVVMTWDCGMAYQIAPGAHGWVIRPRDQAALVAALTEALTSADLAAMGRAGRAMVERRLSWRQNAEALVAGIRGDPDPNPMPAVPAEWLVPTPRF